MSTQAVESVGLRNLLRDLRHHDARAASDLADWLVHLAVEGKADRTIYAYHRTIAQLLREHPELALDEFTHSHVNDILAMIPARSRHINRSIIGQFFAWAVWDERREKNPMDRVPRIRNPKRRPKDIFSEAEVALLESLPAPDGQLFTLMFTTGLRKSEAMNLRREHVDLNRERLIVYQGKGSKDRIIALPPSALQAVADIEILDGVGGPQHLWYRRLGKGSTQRRIHPIDPIGATTFENWYRRCIDAAGVRYLNPHQTRHTYGHRLREHGFDLEERQLLMGHESVRTTQHYYGRLTIEDVAAKMREASL